jgi:hypothetical protein
MAAILSFGPVPGHDVVPAIGTVREVIFLDQQLRLRDRGGPAASWRREADGRLVCRWTPRQ